MPTFFIVSRGVLLLPIMKHPGTISITDYSYELPTDRIAKYPLEERDASKLLVYKDGQLIEDQYKALHQFLPERSLLIVNNTKVVQARLWFQNQNGGKIELFCLEPPEGVEVASGMASAGAVEWMCMVGGLSKWKEEELQLRVGAYILRARLKERKNDIFLVRFEWEPVSSSFAELLDGVGVMPIPPYLKRGTESIDLERYQTIFAVEKGSVAAPTAGLHFTDRVFEQLAAKSIFPAPITLHVGAGTFKPVKAERMEDHSMHAEYIDVERNVLELLLKAEDRTRVVVGTTSMRTIESLYWLGVKVHQQPMVPPGKLHLEQWEPYELVHLGVSAEDALQALVNWLEQFQLDRLVTTTGILIAPGYRFQLVDALVTNFHQPQSTLILLIAALIGDDWKKVYQYAMDNDFRFLSYGDGSLLFRDTQ